MPGTAGGKLKLNSLLTIYRIYSMKWLQREEITSHEEKREMKVRGGLEKELSGEGRGGGRRRRSDRGQKKNML